MVKINKGKTRLILGFLIVLTLGFIGISRQLSYKDVLCKDCNVILVSLDTLAAEHMQCYGYERDTAENLCEFGKENIFFENVYANSSWTLPSHASIFTGVYPSKHRIFEGGDEVLSEEIYILPELLKKKGYETVFQIPVSDDALSRERFFNKGIDQFNEYSKSWLEVLKSVKRASDEGDKRFVFLHNYYVHDPYTRKSSDEKGWFVEKEVEEIPDNIQEYYYADEDFVRFFLKDFKTSIDLGLCEDEEEECLAFYDEVERNQEDVSYLRKMMKEKILNENSKAREVLKQNTFRNYFLNELVDDTDPEHVEYLKALYDQEIYELDEGFGEFLEEFYGLGLDKNTILIVTSDHGEEFMEHGFLTHVSLYDKNVHVPLMMYVPGLGSKHIVEDVESVDILPTILDVVGSEVDYKYKYDGKSLVELMKRGRDSKLVDRFLVGEGMGLKSKTIRKDDWKLFLRRNSLENEWVEVELYDTKTDPGEQNNVLMDNFDFGKSMWEDYQGQERKRFKFF